MPLHIKHRLLCLQYKVHLLPFQNQPGLTLVTNCWKELFPDKRNFCSFNMFTKQLIYLPTSVYCRFLNYLPGPCTSRDRPARSGFYTLYGFPIHFTSYPIVRTWALQPTRTYLYWGSATATTAGSGIYIESINKRFVVTLTQTTSSFCSELYDYSLPSSLLFHIQIYEGSNPHK